MSRPSMTVEQARLDSVLSSDHLEIQRLEFHSDYWTGESANRFVANRGFTISRMTIHGPVWQFQLRNVHDFQNLRTLKLNDNGHIYFVVVGSLRVFEQEPVLDRREGERIKSISFPKPSWSLTEAIKWLQKWGYKAHGDNVVENSLANIRFHQLNAYDFDEVRRIMFHDSDGNQMAIRAVVGVPNRRLTAEQRQARRSRNDARNNPARPVLPDRELTWHETEVFRRQFNLNQSIEQRRERHPSFIPFEGEVHVPSETGEYYGTGEDIESGGAFELPEPEPKPFNSPALVKTKSRRRIRLKGKR